MGKDVYKKGGGVCTWKHDPDGFWRTDCHNGFCFEVDGPKENGFMFCPYCRAKIKVGGEVEKPIKNKKLTDQYLEKEINVIMLTALGGPHQKLSEALKAWAKMLIHRVSDEYKNE